MPVGFVAYIDESGDEGFTFKDFPERASSEWLILSAYILHKSDEIEQLKNIGKVVRPIEKFRQSDIHFHKLPHEQRIAVCHAIGQSNARAISICFDKRMLTSESLKEKHKLYFYAVRCLTERISWLVKNANSNPNDDLTVKLIFSNRSKMSYDDLRDYLRLLKSMNDPKIKINWNTIDFNEIITKQHNQLYGLKCADVLASSVARGLELSPYGFTEYQYIKQLEPIFYKSNNKAVGYGLKFFPSSPNMDENNNDRYSWIKTIFPK